MRNWSTPAFAGERRFSDEQHREAFQYAEGCRGKPYIGVDFDRLDELSDSERLALAVVILSDPGRH